MDIKEYIDSLDDYKQIISKNYDIRNLKSYNNITDEKKELIISVFPYLLDESFLDIKQIYGEKNNPLDRFGFVQTYSPNGKNVLLPIRLSWNEEDMRPSSYIKEEALDRKIKRIRKFGSQRYTYITITKQKNTDELDYAKIYYTDDGNVFISGETAHIIQYKDINDLGFELAMNCKYRRKYIKERNERYSRLLNK